MDSHYPIAPDELDQDLPFSLLLELSISDPDMVRELACYSEGKQREEYALSALRIGLLAMKQVRGQLDGETIKREGDRLLATLDGRLTLHARGLGDQIATVLKDYFDPESGRVPERIQRLIRKDGELEDLLRRQIGQQDSELCKTLGAHFGGDSPLMKLLSPQESEGLLQSLSEALRTALDDQRARVLAEFSLDNEEGALCRLMKRLNVSHGEMNTSLREQVDRVVKEFSLDSDDSALSRLVRSVTAAQVKISDEFSLDNEHSALSRMSRHLKSTSDAIDHHLTLDKETSALYRLRRELLELLGKHTETSQRFQEEVKQTLAEIKIRREEARRSTLHGKEFERVVFEWMQNECQQAGELAEFTGDRAGVIKHCKVGDVVIELGPDHAAAGARIAIEAKDKAGYLLKDAREEMETARKNRGAGVGLFIFARGNAPEGLTPFQRIGDDLFVVWDAADPTTDVYLQAGLMVARALCTRLARHRQASAADFDGIDAAILDIEKKTGGLDEIRVSAEGIKSGAEKILKRVHLTSNEVQRQIETLRRLVEDLKSVLPTTGLPPS